MTKIASRAASLMAAVLMAGGLAVSGAPAQTASAHEPAPWRIEHTWYQSFYTCKSRGLTMIEMGQADGWRCRQDEYSDPGRWTLWIYPA